MAPLSPQASRDPALAGLLSAAEAMILGDAAPGSDAARAAGTAFDRARARAGSPGDAPPASLAVGDAWLAAAMAVAEAGRRAPVARALAPLLPRLAWHRRSGSETAAAAFRDGHANAMVLGPRGLEQRDDLWIGLTLMAPGVLYADHNHPPEEVYLPLTPGEWWNARMDWTDPGDAGLIYNPPGIRHAMRAGPAPFLALWLLPA